MVPQCGNEQVQALNAPGEIIHTGKCLRAEKEVREKSAENSVRLSSLLSPWRSPRYVRRRQEDADTESKSEAMILAG